MTTKFHSEQHARHGGTLHWPGAHNLPFRGDVVPHLTSAEREKLPVVGDFHAKTFDLSDAEDHEYYEWVQERISHRLFASKKERWRWHEDGRHMIVYLEWLQFYVQLPPALTSRMTHASSSQFTLR